MFSGTSGSSSLVCCACNTGSLLEAGLIFAKRAGGAGALGCLEVPGNAGQARIVSLASGTRDSVGRLGGGGDGRSVVLDYGGDVAADDRARVTRGTAVGEGVLEAWPTRGLACGGLLANGTGHACRMVCGRGKCVLGARLTARGAGCGKRPGRARRVLARRGVCGSPSTPGEARFVGARGARVAGGVHVGTDDGGTLARGARQLCDAGTLRIAGAVDGVLDVLV